MKRSVKTRIGQILSVLLVLLLSVLLVAFWSWHNEIGTLASFRLLREADFDHLDGAVYYMDVKGGYYLDDFVAQGGVETDDALISFITGKITKGLIPMEVRVNNIGCTSFTAVTEGGSRLFGRNYDISPTNVCLVRTDPGNGRHASISTVDLRFLGIRYEKGVTSLMNKITCLAAPYAPMDGVNDAGVACGIYMTYQEGGADQKTDRPDMTSSTLTRMILDYAGSVEDAVAIAEAYDLHDSAKSSYHYMVADATGKSAILEWVAEDREQDSDGSARRLVVTYNDDDAHIGPAEGASDFQWVSNFLVLPDYYTDDSQKKGLDRYNAVYELLVASDGVVADDRAAMDILAAVGRRTWDGGAHATIHSAVYDLTTPGVYWVSNEHYGEPDACFRLSVTK